MALEASTLSFRIAKDDEEQIQNFINEGYYTTVADFALDSIRMFLLSMNHEYVTSSNGKSAHDYITLVSQIKGDAIQRFSEYYPLSVSEVIKRDRGIQVALNVSESLKDDLIEIDRVMLGLKSYQNIGMYSVYMRICQLYKLGDLIKENREIIQDMKKRTDREKYSTPSKYKLN